MLRPICGVEKPNIIVLDVPRGLIGGVGSLMGCAKLSEAQKKNRATNVVEPNCVVCNQPCDAYTFKTYLRCGHWLHVKYDCFTKW